MDDLVQWLRAQLDEDEAEARRGYLKAEPLPDFDGWDKSTTAGLPPAVAARVLREIEMKRGLLAEVLSEPHFMSVDDHWNTCPAIVDEDGVPVCLDESRAPGPCDCGRDARVARRLRLFVLPFADRPGFQEAWRP